MVDYVWWSGHVLNLWDSDCASGSLGAAENGSSFGAHDNL